MRFKLIDGHLAAVGYLSDLLCLKLEPILKLIDGRLAAGGYLSDLCCLRLKLSMAIPLRAATTATLPLEVEAQRWPSRASDYLRALFRLR